VTRPHLNRACRTTESTRQEASSCRAWHRAPEELAQPGSLPRHRCEILDDTIRATAGLLSDHQHTDRPAPRPIAALPADRRHGRRSSDVTFAQVKPRGLVLDQDRQYIPAYAWMRSP